jgi:hypothetical protein
MPKYIHQQANWTHFTWDDAVLSSMLGKVQEEVPIMD